MGCLRKSKNGSHENESSGAAYKGARKGHFKFLTKSLYQLGMKFCNHYLQLTRFTTGEFVHLTVASFKWNQMIELTIDKKPDEYVTW